MIQGPRLPALLLATGLVSLAQSQLAPVVGPRGVVNAYTQEPSPSTVAPGGLIWINGLNFGSISDTQVLVNGAAAGVLSVSIGRIVAQVPWETASGLAEVVVRQGEARSRAARMVVQPVAPSVRAVGDSGYGEAVVTTSGDAAVLSITGLGARDASAVPVIVHVGGLVAETEVKARDQRPGEYDLQVSLPAGWQPGDVISLRADVSTANRTTLGKTSRPEVTFVRLPSDAPELSSLTGSDLRGNYLIASAARDAQGCSPSFLFDAAKTSATRIDACLVSGNQNDTTPVIAESEGPALAALLGPAEGQAPAGVSSKVLIFRPERADPISVQLPSAASNLLGTGSDGITAVLAGDAVRRVTIDTRTGEVRDSTAGGAALPGGAGLGMSVDLGDGMNQALSAPAAGVDGSFGVVVGDSAEQPTRMKFAIVSAQGEITSQPFPENWLALLGPVALSAAAGSGGQSGAGGSGPSLAAVRATVVYHSLSNEFYVLARNSSNSAHGLVAFPKDGSSPRVVRFPDGWFAAACTARVPLYSFQLSSVLAVPVTLTLETEAKNSCLARGLAVVEPGAELASVVSLPPQAPLDIAAGSAGSMNDFIYSGNGTTPDSLVVFDAAMGAASQFNLPAGVASFAGVTAVSSMNALIASGTRSTQGDSGFVVFDLERSETRTLSLPDRFSTASLAGVFPVTRKLVARGTRSDSTGSQYIVYDLVSGDAMVVPNPEGVAWVGSLPQQTSSGLPGGVPPGGGFPGGTPPGGTAPGGGFPGGSLPTGVPSVGPASAGLEQVNTKANTLAAVCFDPDSKQIGVMGVRVP